MPKLYDVSISESSTTVIEEYLEGKSLGNAKLSEKQLLTALKELCSVLEYLHGKNIIHRDIKPSNIILAKDGHIRLIDFDAARMFKDDLEQDTKSLGTRGYAPPEQYGFAQTVGKCTDLNPDKRYISAGQVKRALSYGKYRVICGCSITILLLMILWVVALRQSAGENSMLRQSANENDVPPAGAELTVLPAPDNPEHLGKNGFYYFAVCAIGDGVHYADSPLCHFGCF
ncbi:MAG: protein kinase [Lachnospiraceae bacterium]|nr:protein kinase [Lachnospiraceae bacterium]MCM1236755.1 protein kinase [Ruminococcus flavefaciens]